MRIQSRVLRQQGRVNVHQLSQKSVDKNGRKNPHKTREDNNVWACRGHFLSECSIESLACLKCFVIDDGRRDTPLLCGDDALSIGTVADNPYDGPVEQPLAACL